MKGCHVEEGTVRLFQRFTREGDFFFDIGANMGVYSFLCAKYCGPSGRVYAFEPQAHLIGYLERSLILNKYETRMTVVCAAVSNVHGSQATLFHAANRDGTGIPSLFTHEWLDAESGTRVPTVSVDGYRQEKGMERVDVIKIDTEGAEMLVLRGMQHTLEETPPDLIVLEVLPDTLSFRYIEKGAPLKRAPNAATPENVVQFLTMYGYEPRHIWRDGRLGQIYNHADLQRITWSTNIAFVSPRLKNTRPKVFAVNS
jgi:FkbM family methyltransferase